MLKGNVQLQTLSTQYLEDHEDVFLADRTDTQYDRQAIAIIMSSVCLSVRPSVRLYNAVHCGSEGRCRGLKVVPACSQQARSYLSLQTLLLFRLATKRTEKRIEENANVSFQTDNQVCSVH